MNTSPLWGHPLRTPDGGEVRVPRWAFPRLRRLGLLEGEQKRRLKSTAYSFLSREFDCLTEGLAHLLGRDLSGPQYVVCRCRECRSREEEMDKTPGPRNIVPPPTKAKERR